MTWALIAAAAFVVMEPVTYLVHRFVMHGIGWVLHRSHHEETGRRLEANDAFPVMFAGTTILALVAGITLPEVAWLVPTGIGVTAYGAAYGFVHDVYIHGRLGRLPFRPRPLEHLKAAHRIHHLFGEEPYGMLAPVVPERLRRRVAALDAATSELSAGSGPTSIRPATANLTSVGTRARVAKTS